LYLSESPVGKTGEFSIDKELHQIYTSNQYFLSTSCRRVFITPAFLKSRTTTTVKTEKLTTRAVAINTGETTVKYIELIHIYFLLKKYLYTENYTRKQFDISQLKLIN